MEEHNYSGSITGALQQSTSYEEVKKPLIKGRELGEAQYKYHVCTDMENSAGNVKVHLRQLGRLRYGLY